MPSINSNFDWVDTTNPTERAFSITAKESPNDVIPDFLKEAILWSDCPDWIRRAETVPESLRGYTLVHAVKSGYQQRVFIFGKTRTPAERLTPFYVEWQLIAKDWPTVLYKLWFEKGNIPLTAIGSDGNISSAKLLHERSKFRRGAVYPTWHKISHFLSERPFAKVRHLTPVTDSINYSFDTLSGGFADCLHPDVRFPQIQSSGEVAFGVGTTGVEIGGDLVAQFYPATNMTDWEKHTIEDERTRDSGMYARRLVEAYPPVDDREITN